MAERRTLRAALRNAFNERFLLPQIRPLLERISLLEETVHHQRVSLGELDARLSAAPTEETLKASLESVRSQNAEHLAHAEKISADRDARIEGLEAASANRDKRLEEIAQELGRIAQRLDALGNLIGDTSARLSETDTVLAERIANLDPTASGK